MLVTYAIVATFILGLFTRHNFRAMRIAFNRERREYGARREVQRMMKEAKENRNDPEWTAN